MILDLFGFISILLRIVTNPLTQEFRFIVLVLTQELCVIVLMYILTHELGVIRTAQLFPLVTILLLGNETDCRCTQVGRSNNDEEGGKIPGFGDAGLGGQTEDDGEVQRGDGEQVGDGALQSSEPESTIPALGPQLFSLKEKEFTNPLYLIYSISC